MVLKACAFCYSLSHTTDRCEVVASATDVQRDDELRRTLSTKVLTPCAEPALLRDRALEPAESFVSDDRGRCATASPPDDAALAALSATLVLCNLSCGPGLSAQPSLLSTLTRGPEACPCASHTLQGAATRLDNHATSCTDVYQLC